MNKLTLHNFQLHKHTELEFGKGITVLTGATDSGKSAIFRALRKIACNRPHGSDFIRDEAPALMVNLDDVVYRRTKNTQHYEVDGVKLKAIRASVPSQVEDKLKLSDVNFQSQHQPYFLIGESPGNVAKQVNNLIGAELIHNSISRCKHQLRKAKDRFETSSERVTELETQLETLSFVDSLEKLVTAGRTTEKEVEDYGLQLDALKSLITKAQAIEILPDPTEDLKLLEIPDKSRLDTLQNLITKAQAIEILPDPTEDLKLLEIPDKSRLDTLQNLITKAQAIEVLPDPTENLERLKLLTVIKYLSKLTSLMQNDRKLEYEQKELEQELNNILGDMEICPLCGTVVS